VVVASVNVNGEVALRHLEASMPVDGADGTG
jgi:hypothetical protein